MGKKRGVKKVEGKPQEPSTSSSSKNNRKGSMDKINSGRVEKKLKTESKAKSKQQRVKKSKSSSINDLPPEMLMKILKYLDTKDLVRFRLVNRKWNGISTEILQSRSDLEIRFNMYKYSESVDCQQEKSNSRSFLNFIQCYRDSKNFPCTRFYLTGVRGSTFDNKYWIEFISDFGGNIKCLKLLSISMDQDRELSPLINKLRNLLLIQLPQLEEFGIHFNVYSATGPSAVQLFPTKTTPTPPLTENSTVSKSKSIKLYPISARLPHLKVLYINETMFSKFIGIPTDLAVAAVNLQKIQSFNKNEGYNSVEIFYLLQCLGKLNCLESASMRPNGYFLTKIKERPLSLGFKLKSLQLSAELLYENRKLCSDALDVLPRIFESIKDTLTELKTDSLEFLDGLQLPKFSKLIRLVYQNPISQPLFSPDINLMEIFPALRTLELGIPWTKAFPNVIYCLPSLKTLKVTGRLMDERSISQISTMFPNLKNFKVDDRLHPHALKYFPKVGRAIWTNLKQLQTLEIEADASTADDSFPAFDSCITGFSTEDCERLYDLLVADSLLKKRGSQAQIPKSELEAERKYPSIFDLKDEDSIEEEEDEDSIEEEEDEDSIEEEEDEDSIEEEEEEEDDEEEDPDEHSDS